MSYPDLPHLNALLNCLSTVLLLAGYSFIRKKNRTCHRNLMIAALVSSSLFLISYLIYHARAGSVRFQGQGWIRPIYFAILTSHIVLAALVLPLVVITLWHAWRSRIDQHRKIARWTFPVWLYVSITGVVVYLFLYR